MSHSEVIDVVGRELDEEGNRLVPIAPASPTTLFGTDDPSGVVASATLAARKLVEVAKKQNLIVRIQNKDYPKVECWTMLGSMLGVFPVVKEDHKLGTDGGGWEAYVEARTRAGEIVGGAWAQCTRSENSWKNRDDYALRSMAQTRATSKAMRMPLGFVMSLGGFEATPAEEMPSQGGGPFSAVTEPMATAAKCKKVVEALDSLVASGLTTRVDLDEWMEKRYGTVEVSMLTKSQADEILEIVTERTKSA